MTATTPAAAWLLMTVGDDRQHAGNAGYDDQPDVYYTWDSTVSNFRNIKVGDAVVLWDKRRLLGVSVVEEILESTMTKPVFRCPNASCGRSSIKSRKTKSPKYRCQDCSHEFDRPHTEVVDVIEYRSRHDAAWSSLDGLVLGEELRTLCESPRSQLSMRALNWSAFQSAIESRGAGVAGRAIQRVLGRTPEIFPEGGDMVLALPSGHYRAAVRVRRGQGKFREHLLRSQGSLCAFTGHAPERVLDAGHLYSYAQLGQHHEHGGLLLRRDIHRLFDDGWLAVDPSTLKVDVADSLESFPQYARLHDQSLKLSVDAEQGDWLLKHWAEHRL